MGVLLLGAGGFIGRHILAELIAHGHDVVSVVRSASGVAAAFPGARFVEMNLATATAESDWVPHAAGIDVIVGDCGIFSLLLPGPRAHEN